jgi:coatomer protein complex subunit gamma
LEHQLVVYISTEKFAQPFDLSSIPIVTKEESNAQALRALTKMASGPTIVAEQPKASAQSMPYESALQNYANALSEVPELREFGTVLKSSLKPVELTEKETEYTITAVKHIFHEHIVFQVFPFKIVLSIV